MIKNGKLIPALRVRWTVQESEDKVSPDKRQHRGAHPADRELFAEVNLSRLRAATSELSWLLSRGYAMKATLKLVGDQYSLTERQRLAVSRAACTEAQRESRGARCLPALRIENEYLFVDGFNLIITVEAALGGGLLILCRDECIRDLSSVHGSYRSVMETDRAIGLVGDTLECLKPKAVRWFLDRPISNSGRLARRLRDLAEEHNWSWSVDVVFNPDAEILSSDGIVVTSDSLILDRAARWVNLNRYLVEKYLTESWVIDLRN